MSDNLCSYYIDCKGAVGRYVRVHLPGTQRIFDAKVTVNVLKPVLPQDAFVCYAVEAREAQVLPKPVMEVTITDDPMDPAFYSTCYVREQDIQWRPTPKGPPAKAKWQYNGQCLACSSFEQNQLPHNRTEMPAIPWVISDRCEDCDGQTLAALASSIRTAPSSDDGAVGAGTVIGWLIFFALLFVVAGLAFKHRAMLTTAVKGFLPASSSGSSARSSGTAPNAGDFKNPLADGASEQQAPVPPRPAPPSVAAAGDVA